MNKIVSKNINLLIVLPYEMLSIEYKDFF